MPTGTIPEPPGYAPLRRSAAWCDLPRRAVVEVTGADAVAFIDRFATAALGGLRPGESAETFFTDVRGWVLALALVLRRDDGLEIDAGPAARVALADHLEHYHVRERLEVHDASARRASFLVAGPAAATALAALLKAPPVAAGGHVGATVGTAAVCIARVDWFRGVDGFLVRCAVDDAATVRDRLRDSGLPNAAAEAVEALRIEAGFPDPVDIPEKTLPQELDRPPATISFTKGCYLGQETVARLDALGHVNRTLSLLATNGRAAPPSGTMIRVDGAEAGVVTSSCVSPLHAAPVALGIVHRRGHAPGAAITIGGDEARIVPFSLPPRTPSEGHAP